jgi:hypothetical protein
MGEKKHFLVNSQTAFFESHSLIQSSKKSSLSKMHCNVCKLC